LTAKLSDRNGVSTQTSININTTNGDSVSISNLLVSEITSSGATISYATDKTTDSSIFIGLSANNYDLQKYGGLQTKYHSLTLSSLKSNTKYYYKITATTLDGLEGTTQGSFATL
jgi:hypothetical protein